MIGPNVLEEIKRSVGALLDRYLPEIDQAYVTSENGLKISLTAKIAPSDRRGFLAVETGISFVQKKVKNSVSSYVSESQDPLIKAVENLRPKKGSGIDSVSISHPASGQSVTLGAKD